MKSVGIGIVVLLAAAVALSGCSIVVSPTGFSTPSPAFVYTNMKFPSMLQEAQAKDDYKILGEVHGTSRSRNILNIAATGDNGIEKAYKDALQKVGGDAIINARVDSEASSILFLYTTVTTHVYGTAIKYNK